MSWNLINHRWKIGSSSPSEQTSSLAGKPTSRSRRSSAWRNIRWLPWSDSKKSSLAYYLAGGSSNALLLRRPSPTPSGTFSCISSERDTLSRKSRSMSIGLREHAWNHIHITHVLRDCSNQWGSLQRRGYECQRWLLQTQKRDPRHLLNNASRWSPRNDQGQQPVPKNCLFGFFHATKQAPQCCCETDFVGNKRAKAGVTTYFSKQKSRQRQGVRKLRGSVT